MQKTKPSFKFASFQLDPSERLLTQHGAPVAITPKAFDLLEFLLNNRGRLVERTELMERIWPGTYVEEANLTQHISTLRKTLGEEGFIETVPKRGYRFVASVEIVDADSVRAEGNGHAHFAATVEQAPPPLARPRWHIVAALCALVAVGVAIIWQIRKSPSGAGIRTIAILPLRTIPADAPDQHLGHGIANAIILQTSQLTELTVRPLGTMQKYAGTEMDPLAAGREQRVDAVLEGTIQRSGGRLRTSVRLLRISDGATLWAESMDTDVGDIFKVQDTVARQIASRLQLKARSVEWTRGLKSDTTSAEAYEYYLKAMRLWEHRGQGLSAKANMDSTIAMFAKAIELDPNYGRAHAMLAFAYVSELLFVDPSNASALNLARQHLHTAQMLDPLIAETHVARHELLWSVHEGFNIAEAIRELRLAQRLDPNTGHTDLGMLFAHIGLEEQAVAEFGRAQEIDPLSSMGATRFVEGYRLLYRLDDAIALHQKLTNRPGPLEALLQKGQVSSVEAKVKADVAKDPTSPYAQGRFAMLLALQGKFAEAQAQVPDIRKLEKNRSYHHATYSIATVYALQGNASEAVKWLRATADTGMPSYLLFTRDTNLDRIRQAPEFVAFLAEMKAGWEALRREFR